MAQCSTEPQKRVHFAPDLNLSENENIVYEELMKAEETDRSGLANLFVTMSLRGLVELDFAGQPEKMKRLVKLLKEDDE